MNKEIAIQVSSIGKKYRLNHQKTGTIRDTFSRFWRANKKNDKHDFWALKDVSFEISKGDVVGIIGSNGAGKSTLLKILSRITSPTTGRIELRGRVASLLEVGTGFHHELTGRENIYLNGSILGMSRVEIKEKFDEIVAFSGIEKFLDTPVKHYSSGMYVRLAFSVAAHLEAEIILIDEVLAVGDNAFQQKCLGKMNEMAGSGRTVIIVSHNLAQIQKLCLNSILLEQGNVIHHGITEHVLSKYNTIIKKPSDSIIFKQQIDKEIFFSEVSVLNSTGRSVSELYYGEPFSIQMEITSSINISEVAITIELTRHTGEWVFSSISSQSNQLFNFISKKKQIAIASYKKLIIRPGSYSLHLSIAHGINHRYYNLVLNNFITISDITHRDTPSYEGYWGTTRVYPEWNNIISSS